MAGHRLAMVVTEIRTWDGEDGPQERAAGMGAAEVDLVPSPTHPLAYSQVGAGRRLAYGSAARTWQLWAPPAACPVSSLTLRQSP